MTGMDVDEDDDNYVDDDFPDIAEDELRQLEQNAISFTQNERASLANKQVLNGLHGRSTIDPPGLNPHQRSRTISGTLPSQQNRSQARLQHSFTNGPDPSLDENGLPLVVEERLDPPLQRPQDEVTQREQWRRNRFSHPIPRAQPITRAAISQSSGRGQQPPTPVQPEPVVARQSMPLQADSFSTLASAVMEEESLRLKVEELTANLVKVEDELVARKGEIQIIRAKQIEGEKVHRRELDTLRKLKHEETEKHKLVIEALNAEKSKTTSDIQFMKKELNDETRRVQSLQRSLKERPLRDKSTNLEGTPKRNPNSLRDGFDEEDLMNVSPVKSGRRSNRGTPTANRKRKQLPGSEVNVQPLALRPSLSMSDDAEPGHLEVGSLPTKPSLVRRNFETEENLRLVQQVFALRSSGSRVTLIEDLMKLAFPSDPSQTLGSIVIQSTARLSGKRLPADLLAVFIGLWSTSLEDKYYEGLGLIIEVAKFILDNNMFVVDAGIITSLLPLLQSTAEINATTRFRLLVTKDWLDTPDGEKPRYDEKINVTACLDLLFDVACLISDEEELISTFWRTMSTDFVLMMLNACQPVRDVMLMLQLLATSILPQTFGNICTTDEQNRMETYIIDRICYLLWETPRTLEGERPYLKHVICKLRIEAVDLLGKLTIGSSLNPSNPLSATNHGTIFIANHVTAIARLIRSIYDETTAMYLVTPSQALHATLVNNAVHVLYFILNSPAGRDIDLQHKLAGTNGGVHKHRVVLTRLAFSEGIYIDRGITEETVRMATELLEDSVTPDEANDLTAAFGGSMGRSGSTQQEPR